MLMSGSQVPVTTTTTTTTTTTISALQIRLKLAEGKNFSIAYFAAPLAKAVAAFHL